MLYTINIGRKCPVTGALIPRQHILDEAKVCGQYRVRFVFAGEYASDSEPTVVLVCAANSLSAMIGFADTLCGVLRQEAVAFMDHNGNGRLVGPKASEWGPFNPDLFITADGSRA